MCQSSHKCRAPVCSYFIYAVLSVKPCVQPASLRIAGKFTAPEVSLLFHLPNRNEISLSTLRILSQFLRQKLPSCHAGSARSHHDSF